MKWSQLDQLKEKSGNSRKHSNTSQFLKEINPPLDMLGDIKRDRSNPNLEVSELSQIQNVPSTNGAGADRTNALHSPKGVLNPDSI